MEEINVIFKNTKTRNIRISVKQDLKVIVSFPKRYPQKKAEQFFNSKIIWVKNSLEKMRKIQQIREKHQEEVKIKLAPEEILDKKHYLILRCRELAQQYNFRIKKVILRNQKSIWGSCSVENNISLNSKLIYLRNELIDYVILHELVHTIVKNHSKSFWGKLKEILPNYHELNNELKKYRL